MISLSGPCTAKLAKNAFCSSRRSSFGTVTTPLSVPKPISAKYVLHFFPFTETQ